MRTPTPPGSAVLLAPRALIWFAGLLTSALVLAFAAPALADDAVFPPAAGSAPAMGSQPSSPDNNLAPSWSFSGPGNATFECSLARGDTVVGDWTPCVSPVVYDLSSQPDGVYS